MAVSIEEIQNADYVILKREDLENLLVNVRLKNVVDKRVKWIDRKTAIKKYAVSRYWLSAAEKDCNSLLKKQKGLGKTATVKYLEQSIIEEQKRQSELC